MKVLVAAQKTKILLAIFIFIVANIFFSTIASAQVAMRGQLNFQLQIVGEPIRVSTSTVASQYQQFEQQISAQISDGASSLALVRNFEETAQQMVDQTVTRIRSIIYTADDQDAWTMLDNNPWANPIFQYVEGNEEEDVQPYERVNNDLRTGNQDSAETITWTTSMRQALSRVPKFEGISFRGTRLSPDRIDRYFPVGGVADDLAFISSSILPSVSFKFAKLWHPEQATAEEKALINLVIVIKGKTGRPVSPFGRMHTHEQEILFANGTKFNVLAKSSIVNDNELGGPTQIILLQEQ